MHFCLVERNALLPHNRRSKSTLSKALRFAGLAMTKQQIKSMIMELFGEIDYDLAKSLDPKMAEDPEYAEEQMERLIKIVERHQK